MRTRGDPVTSVKLRGASERGLRRCTTPSVAPIVIARSRFERGDLAVGHRAARRGFVRLARGQSLDAAQGRLGDELQQFQGFLSATCPLAPSHRDTPVAGPMQTTNQERDQVMKNCIRSATLLLCLAALAGAQGSYSPVPKSFASSPGAMKLNGDFFILQTAAANPNLVRVVEWRNAGLGGWWASAWAPWQQDISNGSLNPIEEPAGLTPTGGIHYRASNPNNALKYLVQWEPSTGFQNLGAPPSTFHLGHISDVMYGNRVYLSSGPNLLERSIVPSLGWANFGPSANNSPPCVLEDGQLFVANGSGELVQLSWPNSVWTNHGVPAAGVTVKAVGAPSPNQVFMYCSDGAVRHRYKSGTEWYWANQGLPFGLRASGKRPEAAAEGHVFVTAAAPGVPRRICYLRWDGTWTWHDIGVPPGSGGITGSITSTSGSGRVAVKGQNGSYYLLTLGPGPQASWTWRDCGKP